MKLLNLIPAAYLFLVALLSSTSHSGTSVRAQEPLFELPVQLIGFPVIILSVRLANFAKKLAYSLNPKTYQSRSRRATLADGVTPTDEDISRMAVDVAQAERRILQEFGPKACIEEEPCRLHAVRTTRNDNYQPDWSEILKLIKNTTGSDHRSRGTEMCPFVLFFLSLSLSLSGFGPYFRNYKVRATGMKQWYLLSVFIGDYIRDVQFCKQMAKRLACDRNQKEFIRD